MPKILRIVNRLNVGGPTYNVAYLSRYLPSDYETLLVSGMKQENEESSEHIVQNLGLKPLYIPDMHRSIHPLKDYKSYSALKKIIREFKPDIVHTHASKAGTIGRLAAYHCDVPVIVHTFHGHVFHSYFTPAKTRMFLEIERYLAGLTTKIIALSDSQKHELSVHYKVAPMQKFAVIPLGFDLDRFNQNTENKRKAFRTKFDIRDDEIAIAIVGRLVPIKNHQLFLNAIDRLVGKTSKRIHALIVGDGEERTALEKQVIAMQVPLKRNLRITFTGWYMNIDEVNAGADIVALTSKNEGTPVSLIEAQASGKPVVTTKVGGVESVVLDKVTGFVSAPGDVNDFVEYLKVLVNDTSLRQSMGNSGRKMSFEKFSYTRLCTDMDHLYRNLLTERGSVR